MSYGEAKELAQLRQLLRDRLAAHDARGMAPALERLRQVAGGDHELRAEYERWTFRFDLLRVAA
ncbi:MAG: hypothetical protein K8W52_35390 [Deltaproteobacteria bacterium]|nr:hypothetical protein [Deltaproteobacteria bacterium]